MSNKILLLIYWAPIHIFLIIGLFFILQNYSITAKNNLGKNTVIVRSQPVYASSYDNQKKIKSLSSYLESYGSSLSRYSTEMVAASIEYGIDYTLIPAIALQESQGCKKIPDNSNNCWGYGIYKDNVIRFSSPEKGIDRVARLLKKIYKDHNIYDIKYAVNTWKPHDQEHWINAISFFQAKIREQELLN